MQQTEEQTPTSTTRVYPLPPQIENRMQAGDVPRLPPGMEFTDGAEDVETRQAEKDKGFRLDDERTNHSWQPAFALGVAGLSGALVGSFFGIPGVLVGAVGGTALGILNELSKGRRLQR
jgi:hypothetical protein